MLDQIRIVLVNTSHPGNIGAAARAMKTMGLSRLYLVAPLQFPHNKAQEMASGATDLVENAHVVSSLAEATADCSLVIGTSTRNRKISWPIFNPREMVEKIKLEAKSSEIAILFGREQTGLTNEELHQCHWHIQIPANPVYSSLNIAAAVQVIAYELHYAFCEYPEPIVTLKDRLATNEEMEGFYHHLQTVLIQLDFLKLKAPRQLMTRLRRLFYRIRPELMEINILRGMLSAVQQLTKKDSLNLMELTILMPCLNESQTIANCIVKAKKFLEQENVMGEVLVADNGSLDGSKRIAQQYGARIVDVGTKGYGAALKHGIRAAQGRYVIMGDADDSYDFLNLHLFLARLREGFDLVMGNRFQGGIIAGAMPRLNRYLGNPVLSFLGRIFFSSNIGDFHCGLRGFQRERMLNLELQGDGMEFASEMVVKATLQNFKITEVPTKLYPDGRNRRPHLRPWRDGWRHLRLLLLLSPRWLFFFPGLMLMLFGFILMGLLLLGPVVIGHINLDIHTMLFSALFIIVGLQAVCFSIYARMIVAYQLNIFSFLRDVSLMLRWFSLERGLILGSVFILIGASGACYSLWYWIHQAFGPLIPTKMMRVLIPSVTCLILGIQCVFASFFMSLLSFFYPFKK